MNASLEGLIKAFDRAAGGLRARSSNGREVVSKFHSPKGDGYDIAVTKPLRGYSKLVILGERRPYTLQVQYIIEKRDSSGAYDVQGYDEAKAQSVLKKILEFLATRPDRTDFIDDFRPF